MRVLPARARENYVDIARNFHKTRARSFERRSTVPSRMTLQPAALEKEELVQLCTELGLGRPASNSGPLPGWGNRRYAIETPKGHFELRVRSIEEEFDLRREIDLLTYLEKHEFPSPRVMLSIASFGSPWRAARSP